VTLQDTCKTSSLLVESNALTKGMAVAVDSRDARRETILYAALAYTAPPGSESAPSPRSDALDHVVTQTSASAGAPRSPTGATIFEELCAQLAHDPPTPGSYTARFQR